MNKMNIVIIKDRFVTVIEHIHLTELESYPDGIVSINYEQSGDEHTIDIDTKKVTFMLEVLR